MKLLFVSATAFILGMFFQMFFSVRKVAPALVESAREALTIRQSLLKELDRTSEADSLENEFLISVDSLQNDWMLTGITLQK